MLTFVTYPSAEGKKKSVRFVEPALLAAAIAVLLHLILACQLAISAGPASDAHRHIAAAIELWQHGRLDVYPVSGPLPHLVAGLPLAARGVELDPEAELRTFGTRAITSVFDPDGPTRNVALARLAMLFFDLLVVLGIYRAAAVLWGKWAAAGAVAFWCFHPLALTWSPTMTHDVAGAAAALWGLLATAAYINRPDSRSAVLVGAVWGFAVLCRLSHLVPATAMPLIVTGVALWKRCDGRMRTAFSYGLISGMVCLCVINAGYLFQGTGRTLSETLMSPRVMERAADLFDTAEQRKSIADSLLGRVPVPLPQPLVQGLLIQTRDFRRWKQPSGSTFQPGPFWWVEGNVRKLPVGLLVYGAAGAVVLVTALRRSLSGLRGTLAALCLGWLLYYGWLLGGPARSIPFLRYSIPVLPVLIVLLSGVLEARFRGARFIGLVALLTGAMELLVAFPHTASYFNPVFGGIEAAVGRVHRQDIDNGQDVYYVVHWVKEHPEARPLVLEYEYLDLLPVDWGPDVRAATSATPYDWVVTSINPEAYGGRGVPFVERRRCVARPTLATVVYSPVYDGEHQEPDR